MGRGDEGMADVGVTVPSVAVTAQGLSAGVSTGGGGLCAGQPHLKGVLSM